MTLTSSNFMVPSRPIALFQTVSFLFFFFPFAFLEAISRVLVSTLKIGSHPALVESPAATSVDELTRESGKQFWKAVTKKDSQRFELLPAIRPRALRVRDHPFIFPKINTERLKNIFIHYYY